MPLAKEGVILALLSLRTPLPLYPKGVILASLSFAFGIGEGVILSSISFAYTPIPRRGDRRRRRGTAQESKAKKGYARKAKLRSRLFTYSFFRYFCIKDTKAKAK